MAYNLDLFVSVLEKNIDNRGKTPPLSPTGYPLIEVKHIQEDHLYPVFEDTKYVDQETWDTWFRAHLEPGDILFSTVGSIARTCMVPEEPKFCIAQNVLGFRVNRSKADPRFLYYAINDSFFQHEVHGRTIETVQKSIKVEDLKTCRIPIPPLPAQKAIAHILGTLDDKIELNRGTNATLEALAQAVFKSWFLDATQAGLPEGWGETTLGGLASIQGGKQLPTEECQSKGAYPVFGANGIMGYAERVTHEKFVIAFGRVGAYCGSIHWAYGGAWINNNASAVVPHRWPEFVLQAMLNVDFAALRTGSAQPFIPNSALAAAQVLRPPDDVLENYSSVVGPVRLEQAILERESCTLAALRDALLPKLLSGSLRIPSTE